MTIPLTAILLLLASIFFLFGAFGVTAKVDWTNLGRACVALAVLVWVVKG